MKHFYFSILFLSLILTVVAVAASMQQHTTMPAGMSHEEHMAQMKKETEMKQHGNAAMGFDQDSTTHHFLIASDGGSIAVDANDLADQESIAQIRSHLQQIAIAFKRGDFGKPLETHGEYPAGVPVMQRLKDEITYAYAETPRGGIVRIVTANPEALAAVHAFLAYQVKEHATGDPLTPGGTSASAPESHPQHVSPSGQPDHFAHRFDDPAEYVGRFDDPKRDEWQLPERVIDALGLKPGDSVADIGAGTGYFTIRLAKSAAKPVVYAVDIEQAMVEHTLGRAKQEGLGNVIGVKADADRPNLPAPVDVVLIVDTFHHLPNRVAYFRALKQQLKAGARVAIIDWRKDSPEGPPVEFRYSPEQISAELAEAGLALAVSHDFLPRQHFLIFRAR
jgi:SAM-dependent methyltransferase